MKKLFLPALTFVLLLSCGSNKTEPVQNTIAETKTDSVPKIITPSITFPEYTEGEITWGEITNGLQMGIATKGDTVFFYYKNCGKKDICMWSHTTGYGLTWNSLELISNSADTIKFEFDHGDREKPGISETACIKPGNISATKEQLQEWLTFRMSQKDIPELADGNYILYGFYNGDRPPRDIVPGEYKKTIHWTGKLTAPPVIFNYKKRMQ